MEHILKYFTDLSQLQIDQFSSLQSLYKEWNEKINVISRKDMDNFDIHHVLHSLAIATKFDFPDGYNIMDLGTGGGFPGIPLAIFFPSVNFHMVDSINKKLKVINHVVEELQLKNVTTEHTRAEEILNKKFDVVITRAVASLKDLNYWSKPLLLKKPVNEPKKINGLICLKGGDLLNEIAESNTRPRIWEIEKIFDEPFFKDKFLLYI